MAVCRKCDTENEEGLTRCKACNAIMPVKLGSKSEVRFERVRRQPDLVGVKCPRCETVNPYTRFRCKACNALLTAQQASSFSMARVLMYVGAAAVIAAALLAVMLRGM